MGKLKRRELKELTQIYEMAVKVSCLEESYMDLAKKMDRWNEKHSEDSYLDYYETEDGFGINDESFYYLNEFKFYCGNWIYEQGGRYAVRDSKGKLIYFFTLEEAEAQIREYEKIWIEAGLYKEDLAK